jgi:DnaK suppressor protein
MTDTMTIEAGLRARLATLHADVARIEADRREPLDADFAEQAAELEGRDALGSIEDSHRVEMDAINAALGRIQAGLYGKCRICGIDIPAARLQALPYATTCIADATAG